MRKENVPTVSEPLREGFVLTAHRGAVDRAPENTLLAFRAAEELGFAESELDLQLSRDGHLVLLHDHTFARLDRRGGAPAHQRPESMSLDEIKSIDLGLGERVPTFTEVLDQTSMNLQVEIKAPRAAAALGDLLNRRSQSDRARCMVTSFDPFSLAEFHATGVDLPRGSGLLVADVTSDWAFLLERLPVRNLLLHWPGLTRQIVDEYRSRGYGVFASMFNNAGELERILATGVDGSSTDRPMLAMSLLDEVRRSPDAGSQPPPVPSDTR